ncbi:MAG: hypothetical protein ACJA1F_003164 [Paracoccaceae bacterium]
MEGPSENGLSHMQACVAGNSMPHATSSLSYTRNGSTDDPSNSHGLNPIHRVSDTPSVFEQGILEHHLFANRGTSFVNT